MNRGSLGVRELNQRLQAVLNPARTDEPVWKNSAGSSGSAIR